MYSIQLNYWVDLLTAIKVLNIVNNRAIFPEFGFDKPSVKRL